MNCGALWRNCALEADPEILAIDRLGEEIAPLPANVASIRELISTLEVCHHKSERWVDNIIDAIGRGEATKGLGTRPAGRFHPAEAVWSNACAVLASWCAGSPAASMDPAVGGLPASQLLAGLGERSALKEWQVQRVIARIRSLIHWPQSSQDPAVRYVWILLSPNSADSPYRDECPVEYKEHKDFWLATVRTTIHDIEKGAPMALSLGLAIDMLWPCHSNFVENLQIVLSAIGGNLHPAKAFAACGRNVGLLPARDRLLKVSGTLRAFCGQPEPGAEADADILARLGSPTKAKTWLAASLDKTLRMQLDPPEDLRRLSSLSGPSWIRG